MMSHGVEISIAGDGGEMVRVLSLGGFLFFFFDIIRYLFYIQKALCSASYEEKKTHKSQQPHASPPHGKNQAPRNHRKCPPRLGHKILIPQTRKETIHRSVQVERPKPFCKLPKTEESFAKASKRGSEAEDSDRALEESYGNVGRHRNCKKRTRQ